MARRTLRPRRPAPGTLTRSQRLALESADPTTGLLPAAAHAATVAFLARHGFVTLTNGRGKLTPAGRDTAAALVDARTAAAERWAAHGRALFLNSLRNP